MKPVECEAAEDVGSRSEGLDSVEFPLFKKRKKKLWFSGDEKQNTPKLSFWQKRSTATEVLIEIRNFDELSYF